MWRFVFAKVFFLMLLQTSYGNNPLQITRWIPEPVNLEVRSGKDVPVFSDMAMKRQNGTFAQGAKVQLISYTPEAYLVQGEGTDGKPISGWVDPRLLTPLPPAVLADAQDAEGLRILTEAAIDRREIIIGMTAEDVRKSLGRPWRIQESANPADPLIWIYIHYERAPRTEVFMGSDDLMYSQTTFQQVPAGRLKVSFRGGRVVSYTVEVDQPEGFFDRKRDGNVIIRPDLNPTPAPGDNPVP